MYRGCLLCPLYPLLVATISALLKQSVDSVVRRLNTWPQNEHTSQSAIANIVKTPASRNLKWDHFEIFASGKSDYHCKIKETSYIQLLMSTSAVTIWCFVNAFSGHHGRISDSSLKEAVSSLDRSHLTCYICGPPPMIKHVTDILHRLNIGDSRIHFEKWW